MGDVDEGDSKLPLQHRELALHLDPQMRVERAERLVEEKDFWLGDQRPGDGDPLLLAAAQLADAAREKMVQMNLRGHGLDLGTHRLLVVAPERQPELDVLAHVEEGEERIVLPDQPCAALVHRHVADILAPQQQRACVRSLQAGDDPEQRRLATAARPHDGDELAALDVDIDPLDGDHRAETLGDAAHLKVGDRASRQGSRALICHLPSGSRGSGVRSVRRTGTRRRRPIVEHIGRVV